MNYLQFEPLLGDWGPRLKSFIESPQCDWIYSYLRGRAKEGRIIIPSWENTFRAFRETPFSELKCVFFMMDPYAGLKNGKMIADGIAMSCSLTREEQPSLRHFYDGIIDDLPEYQERLDRGEVWRNPDLTYLCKQGIMMLNTSLTTEVGRSGIHSEIREKDRKIRLWEEFMKYFFLELEKNSGLCLVFAGSESQYYEKLVFPHQHYIFKVEHPAYAERKERSWKHENIFKKINRILWENNKVKVNWLDTK